MCNGRLNRRTNGWLNRWTDFSRWRGTLAATALLAFVHVAHAQLPGVQVPNVQVPDVQVPNLPRVDLPAVTDTVTGTVNGATDALGVRRLADLRQLRIRELLRTQRANVERDPNGEPILRAQIVAFAPTDAALDAARAAGFVVVRERSLEGLDTRLVVLRAPDRMPTRRALARLRALDPNGAYDFNHIYLESGEIGTDAVEPATAESATAESATAESATAEPATAEPAASAAPAGVRIGLVDGGVDVTHPVFKDMLIHQHGCADKSVPSPHGTAVASLMTGRSAMFHGAAPGAELFAADVYCGLGTGGAVDAVVDGIAWIARQHVPVINVSLVGPRNVALENVVRIVIARGFLVVAAVGNDGPAARPLYPASYPGVVGVTGVDGRQKVLLEACRGPQVDFAAPGADMAAAAMAPSFASVRGTSFAAPIVAGLLAALLPEPDPAAAQRAIAQLVTQAVDLGSRGVDTTYGNGLVGNAVRVAPALALLEPAAGRKDN
jgi:subtilisin family serine protease